MSTVYTGAMVNMVLIPMKDEILTNEEKRELQLKCMAVIGYEQFGEKFFYLTRDGKSIEVKVKWMYSFLNH